MPTYLSREWISALDAAAMSDPSLSAAATGVTMVIQQEVSEGPEGDIVWHVRILDGMVRVIEGPSAKPDVTFRQDLETAQAVAAGDMSAQAAFMVGRLRVTGDVGLLMAHHDLFDAVADVFGPVRSSTEY